MKPITNEDIKVLGRIVNISTENVVADASQVWDSKLEKDQETINKELVSKTDLAKTDKYGIVRLAENISDPDNDDVVTMRVLNAAINNLINDAPGTLDTLRELAESISSDPNFYTTVRNWINAESNRLGGRIDALEALYRSLESRVGDLEACCEQVQAYMLQYKIKCGNAAILIPVSGIDSDGGIRHGRDVVFTYTTPEYTEDGNSVVAVYTGTGNALPVTKDSNNRYVISGLDIISNITVYPQYEITNTVVQVNYRYTPGKNNVYNPISWSNTSNSSYILGQAYERVFGGSSEITFLTNQGFVLDNVTATMEGGGTITVTKNQDGSYRVYTSKVTGRITMTEYLSSTEHSITVNKTGTGNVGLSGNVPSTIYHKAPFSKYIDERSNVAVVNSITVTMGGIDITSSAVGERHTVGSVSEIPLTIDSVTDDVVITIDSTATSTPVTYGTVAVSPDHGTASPASFSADGTSHTITITPASGYTTTGMTATTANNDLTVSVSGNKVTVTGTSSNNATINVTVPAESTPTPSGTTANITVTPSYASDAVNENITIGQSWSHTFDIPTYYDTNSGQEVPAYTYTSDTIAMAGGGTITRNGNTFSTANVTGNITGNIVFTVDGNAVYANINVGCSQGDLVHTVNGVERHSSSESMKLIPGETMTVDPYTHYTLLNSFITTWNGDQYDDSYASDPNSWYSRSLNIITNNLEYNASTGILTCTKPLFHKYITEPRQGDSIANDVRAVIYLPIDSSNTPENVNVNTYYRTQFGTDRKYTIDSDGVVTTTVSSIPASEWASYDDDAGASHNQSTVYNDTYSYTDYPSSGFILDTTKGTNGITAKYRMGSAAPFTYANNRIEIQNVVDDVTVNMWCKPDPSITTAKLSYQGAIPSSSSRYDFTENITIGSSWTHTFAESGYHVSSIELSMYDNYAEDNVTITFTDGDTLTISNVTGNIRANVTFEAD